MLKNEKNKINYAYYQLFRIVSFDQRGKREPTPKLGKVLLKLVPCDRCYLMFDFYRYELFKGCFLLNVSAFRPRYKVNLIAIQLGDSRDDDKDQPVICCSAENV